MFSLLPVHQPILILSVLLDEANDFDAIKDEIVCTLFINIFALLTNFEFNISVVQTKSGQPYRTLRHLRNARDSAYPAGAMYLWPSG